MRRRRWFGPVLFAVALAVALARTAALPSVGGVRLRMPWTLNDFKSALYCPAATFVDGGNPYDPKQFLAHCPVKDVFPLYSPSTLIVHAPFLALPIDQAAWLYFALSIALLLVVAHLAYRAYGLRPPFTALLTVAALILLSRPGQWGILLGQPAVELTLFAYAALYPWRSDLIAGLGLGLAMMKPTFGLPLAVLMLAQGRPRAVVNGVVVAVVTTLPPLLALVGREGGFGNFLSGVVHTQSAWLGAVDPATQVYGVDLAGLLARIVGHRLPPWGQALTGILILGSTAVTLRRLRSSTAWTMADLSPLIALALLLCVHHHAYDLVLLAAPVLGVALAPPQGLSSNARKQVLFCAAALACNYVTTESFLGRLRAHHLLWTLLGSINGLLVLAMFLVFLSQAWNAIRPRALEAPGAGSPA